MKIYSKEESLNLIKSCDLFHETTLLRFKYKKNTFKWEGVKTNWKLKKGMREFIKIQFNGVDNFLRKFPDKKPNKYDDTKFEFNTLQFTGTYESEMSRLTFDKDVNKITIFMPYLLGEIIFDFKTLLIMERIGVGKQIDSKKWVYHDLETGDQFKFDKPFE